MTYLQITSKYIWVSPVFLGQYGHSDDYLEGHITTLIQFNDYQRASRSQGMQISTLPAVLDKKKSLHRENSLERPVSDISTEAVITRDWDIHRASSKLNQTQ